MRPLDFECTIGQPFGENQNDFYASIGLRGHTGIDEACGYGTNVHAYAPGHVYSMYTVEHPANDGFVCVYTICQTDLEIFEFSYGHLSQIEVKLGNDVQKGEKIGEEGNKGVVYSGGRRITLAMQARGDRRGSHRHVQKRPLYKVKKIRPGDMPLTTAQGTYRDKDGYYYVQADPNNGYAGCRDFAHELFNKNLYLGSRGYDVYLLQKALIRQGYGNHEPTDYFGTITLGMVREYQKHAGISPALGFFWPKTRAALNAVYKPI